MAELKFEMIKEQSSIIKVIGVGGGGGNAVNHMYKQGISGVDFIICNTDAQALELSPIPNKVQLGTSLTEGMGAGSDPDVGENSAIESIEDIKRMLGVNTKMLFITAGMGGGTGTGASPVLAKAARELGILTVAIVTTPFTFEGKRRRLQAEEGLSELKKYVDSYLVISNDRLREIFGNLTMGAAFAKADDILTTAAKGIAEIITIPGYVNVDFKDVKTVMNDSGVAIMGSDKAEGEDRAQKAVEGALASPLLKDNEIEGARYILLNITSGKKEVTMDEVTIITDYIQSQAGMTADLIWGNCVDESLEDHLSVTIIATGFQTSEDRIKEKENQRVEIPFEETPLVRPVNQMNPVSQLQEIKDQKNVEVETTAEKQETVKVQPIDLFSTFSKKSNNPKAEYEAKEPIVRHTLIEEEEVVEEEELNVKDEYVLKESESEFHFKLTDEYASEERVIFDKQDDSYSGASPDVPVSNPDANRTEESVEEQLRKAKERILRLRDLGIKLRSASGLQEIESEPAFRRKQMSLDNVVHSSESHVSRFTLSKDDEEGGIRPNNSFLHDNVD
ncbi:cell division protein FtsZ [Albibacterium bauzanense]|uniref:Cell division protein FtsZ n=1 Tax=Albibacterium bauzanense TaxID=653929 RepID=A0A4R1M1Q4_9SPHI|nr:cell division protein FtsZ [Albibacterium bauzanense]TCK83529.1 cell division protein FtsZ [Albibacterium bauzanense]